MSMAYRIMVALVAVGIAPTAGVAQTREILPHELDEAQVRCTNIFRNLPPIEVVRSCTIVIRALDCDRKLGREVVNQKFRCTGPLVSRAKAYRSDQSALALADMDASIAMSPELLVSYLNRAEIHVRMGNLDLAASDRSHVVRERRATADKLELRGDKGGAARERAEADRVASL